MDFFSVQTCIKTHTDKIYFLISKIPEWFFLQCTLLWSYFSKKLICYATYSISKLLFKVTFPSSAAGARTGTSTAFWGVGSGTPVGAAWCCWVCWGHRLATIPATSLQLISGWPHCSLWHLVGGSCSKEATAREWTGAKKYCLCDLLAGPVLSH